MTRSIFVTATDTGVGKTLVTATLAKMLETRGYSVGVMKPIETGVVTESRSDAARLTRASKISDSLDLIRPYAFRWPVAPLGAARAKRRMINFSVIMQAYRRLQMLRDLLLVEGVGGVHVPITPTADVLDLIVKMKAPVLIVGRAGLGGVNHALLTLNALRERKVPILALVLNRTTPAKTAMARRQERSTVGLLQEFAGVPVIGPLPYLAGLDGRFERAMAKLAMSGEMRKLTKLALASARGTR